MKKYTLRIKIKNKDRNNKVRTIQYSRDDYQDILMCIREFERAKHIEVLYKHIRDNHLQEKLKIARARVRQSDNHIILYKRGE